MFRSTDRERIPEVGNTEFWRELTQDDTADLIDSLDRMAPELESCGDPPDRLADLRKILDGAARAGMIRVNRLREGATAGVSER
jgi:hypothetical protein